MIDDIKTVEDFKRNAIKLKEEYKVFLDSSFLNIKEHTKIKRHWKNVVYEIKTKPHLEYFRNYIWRYLNNDLNYYEFIELVGKNEK